MHHPEAQTLADTQRAQAFEIQKAQTQNELLQRNMLLDFGNTSTWACRFMALDEVAADSDPITGEPVYDNTSTYGVGRLGGYYSPVLTRVSIESKQTKTDYAEDGRGTQFSEMLNIRSIGFPYLDQHDILVFQDGKRFMVADTNSTYFPGSTMILLQLPNLRLIPATDTTYNIAVPAFPHQ